jgi:hypothetical protein
MTPIQSEEWLAVGLTSNSLSYLTFSVRQCRQDNDVSQNIFQRGGSTHSSNLYLISPPQWLNREEYLFHVNDVNLYSLMNTSVGQIEYVSAYHVHYLPTYGFISRLE